MRFSRFPMVWRKRPRLGRGGLFARGGGGARWWGGSGQGWGDGGYSAGRVGARCGCDRGGGPVGNGHGVYGHATFFALKRGPAESLLVHFQNSRPYIYAVVYSELGKARKLRFRDDQVHRPDS